MNFNHQVETKIACARREFTAISDLSSTEKILIYKAFRQPFQTCLCTISDFEA